MSLIKTVIAAVTLLALYACLAVYREHLIPHNADAERARWLLTGDEPAYLLAARAWAVGDGLNLRHVHEHGEHLKFYDCDIMGPGQFSWRNHLASGHNPLLDRSGWWGDKQFKHHMPGFPLLIAPLSGLHQFRWAVALFEGLLVTALAVFLLWQVRRLPPCWFCAAALAVLAFLGAAPIAFYTTQAFPETAAGVFALMALVLVVSPQPLIRMLGSAVLVATLWLTPRMLPGVILADMVLAYSAVRQRRWLELLVIGAGLALFFGYNLFIWGTFTPPALDPNSPLDPWRLFRGTLISFFGNDVGLFFLNPATWIGAVAAVGLILRHRDEQTLVWTALFVGAVAAVAIYPCWRAGTCPAGRYQTILAYLLLLPALRAFMMASDPWRARLLTTLLVLSAIGLSSGLFMAVEPRFWFRDYHPLFGYVPLQRFYSWLPSSDPAQFGLKRYSIYWLLVFCATLGLFDAGRWLKAGFSYLAGQAAGRSRGPSSRRC